MTRIERSPRMRKKGRWKEEKENAFVSGLDGSVAPIVQAERPFRCVISLFLILGDRETKLFDVLYIYEKKNYTVIAFEGYQQAASCLMYIFYV